MPRKSIICKKEQKNIINIYKKNKISMEKIAEKYKVSDCGSNISLERKKKIADNILNKRSTNDSI